MGARRAAGGTALCWQTGEARWLWLCCDKGLLRMDLKPGNIVLADRRGAQQGSLRAGPRNPSVPWTLTSGLAAPLLGRIATCRCPRSASVVPVPSLWRCRCRRSQDSPIKLIDFSLASFFNTSTEPVRCSPHRTTRVPPHLTRRAPGGLTALTLTHVRWSRLAWRAACGRVTCAHAGRHSRVCGARAAQGPRALRRRGLRPRHRHLGRRHHPLLPAERAGERLGALLAAQHPAKLSFLSGMRGSATAAAATQGPTRCRAGATAHVDAVACLQTPFQAETMEEILELVKRGVWGFTPADTWTTISPEAKDLVRARWHARCPPQPPAAAGEVRATEVCFLGLWSRTVPRP